MFLDKEEDIIGYLTCELKKTTPLLYNGNSFNKKVLRWIKNIEVFKNNSGHDALPPDFYSNEFSCMFDVMRINDSEKKKNYNPVKIRERVMGYMHITVIGAMCFVIVTPSLHFSGL